MKLRKTLIMLLVSIFLILPTACRSVVIVPVILEPEIQEAPTHEPWTFIDAYDPEEKKITEYDKMILEKYGIYEDTFLLSEDHLKLLSKYIINLKDYGSAGWDWVQYYIDELDRVGETFKE